MILGWLKIALLAVYGIQRDPVVLTGDQLASLEIDEIRAQLLAVRRETPIRLISIALIGSIALLYLPLAFVLVSVLVILLCDRVEIWLMQGKVDQTRFAAFPRLAMATIFVGELVYCFPTAIMWQIEDPFTKAISVGILSAALMRLATLRSILPATGFVGLAAQGSMISVSNSYYWLHVGNYNGLAFTSVIAVISLGYVGAAIVQNHRQIRLSAISRLAAQQANEAKGYFLAQMSHELRTPLNAIIGMGTVAQVRATREDDKEALGVLINSAKGLAIVLDDVLDTAAIEEGRVIIRPRIGDLAAEIDLAVALFRQSASDAGVALVTEYASNLPKATRMDFDRLRQCITNLLSNSLKNTRQGHIIVRVRFTTDQALEIDVDDTGSGIPLGAEAAIFNGFKPRTNLAAGNGLGLSISRAIILQMSGEILALPSALGAKMRIRIPIEVVNRLSEPKRDLTPLGENRSILILIVDDIATNRLVAATYLRLLECKAIECSSGPEALATLQSRDDIDLVLLDINMPEMDGLQTLSSIRSIPRNAGPLPVIAMTADAAERDRLRYLGAGMDGYLAKPIDIGVLESEMRRVLDKNFESYISL